MNNHEAVSYAVLALSNLGTSKKKIQQVESEMKWLFDTLSEEEAVTRASKVLE